MNKATFQNITEDNILILDGATGSFLLAAGEPANVCSENWVCDHPDIIIDLQKKYVAAGSDIIYAPTFGASRPRLADYGLDGEIKRINKTLVGYSKEAAGSKALVAGNLSMSSASLILFEDDDFDRIKDVYKEQAGILAEAGCDLFAIETMLNLEEARAAVEACVEETDLPVMVSMSFEANGHTLYGDSPETCAKVLTDSGANVVGSNCSTGPEAMLPIIQKMRSATSLPILAKPNAGMPQPGPNGTVVYDTTEDQFAVVMMQLIENGANLVGGCCGTAPGYIEKLQCLAQNMAFTSKKILEK